MAKPSKATIQAIRAAFRGTASPDQQRIVMAWVVLVSGAYRLSMDDNPHRTAFNEGRRYVGLHLLNIGGVQPDLLSMRAELGDVEGDASE